MDCGESMRRIALVGMVTIDLTYLFDSYPENESENEVSEHKVVLGGLMGRAALTISKLGGEPSLFAVRGTDTMGTLLRDKVHRAGLDCRWVEVEGESQHSVVISSRRDGSRTTLWRGQPKSTCSVREALEEFLNGAEIVLMDATDPVLYAITVDYCSARGIPMVLDTGSGRPWTHQKLALIDYVIAPIKYLKGLKMALNLDQTASFKEVAASSCKTMFAVSEGSEGGKWCLSTGAESDRWEAFQVQTIDSCGAGDAFHGAFTWGIANGLEISEALTTASAVAGLSVTGLGNSALPTKQGLLEFLGANTERGVPL